MCMENERVEVRNIESIGHTIIRVQCKVFFFKKKKKSVKYMHPIVVANNGAGRHVFIFGNST